MITNALFFATHSIFPPDSLSHYSVHKNSQVAVKFLDQVGSLFVYRSPDPKEKGYLRFFPNRILRKMAGTTSHKSKKQLIEMIKTQKFD